jgi:hypothetical protein
LSRSGENKPPNRRSKSRKRVELKASLVFHPLKLLDLPRGLHRLKLVQKQPLQNMKKRAERQRVSHQRDREQGALRQWVASFGVLEL